MFKITLVRLVTLLYVTLISGNIFYVVKNVFIYNAFYMHCEDLTYGLSNTNSCKNTKLKGWGGAADISQTTFHIFIRRLQTQN